MTMHRFVLLTFGLGMLAASAPGAAHGLGEAGELEAARANARAGGPGKRARCRTSGALGLS